MSMTEGKYEKGWINAYFIIIFNHGDPVIFNKKKVPNVLSLLMTQAIQTAIDLDWEVTMDFGKVSINQKYLPIKRSWLKNEILEVQKELKDIEENREEDYWKPKEEFEEKWESEPYSKPVTTHNFAISIFPDNLLNSHEFFKIKKILDAKNNKLLKILKRKNSVEHFAPDEYCHNSGTNEGTLHIRYPNNKRKEFLERYQKGDNK